MCKRSDEDPLVRYFVDEYHLNLLTIPREGAAPGDLYVEDKHGVTAPGNVAGLLDPPPELSIRPQREAMAGLAGVLSRDVSYKVGVGLLENFMIALGAAGVVDKLKAGYERQRAARIRFRFERAERESMDIGLLARAIGRSRLDSTSPLVNAGNRYYLVAAVVRTASLAVVAEDDRSSRVDIGADVLTAVSADAGVTARRTTSGEVTYSGDRPLAIGVEVYDLSYDERARKLRLGNPGRALTLRGPGARPRPVLIGGLDGDALVAVADPRG
jgi:hypothetical protein